MGYCKREEAKGSRHMGQVSSSDDAKGFCLT